MPIKVALYARVSTAGAGQDPETQLRELRQAAAQRGWIVQGEYVDEGISGSSTQRPALDKMMQAAQTGRLNLVVVWKLDRLGRSLQHLLVLIETLKLQGVGFVSLQDAGLDTTTPTGRLLLQLCGAFAEYERCLIQERVRAGVAKAQSNGVHCGRPVKRLDMRPARALLGEGRSLREVARILKISPSTLRRKLAEETRQP